MVSFEQIAQSLLDIFFIIDDKDRRHRVLRYLELFFNQDFRFIYFFFTVGTSDVDADIINSRGHLG